MEWRAGRLVSLGQLKRLMESYGYENSNLLFCGVTATVFVVVTLSGCGSPADTSAVSPEQRAQQTTVGKSVPPQIQAQAQSQAAQQNQNKNQADSMRAQDAKKAQ